MEDGEDDREGGKENSEEEVDGEKNTINDGGEDLIKK